MTSRQQDVLFHKQNQIATITINRPAVMNAMNIEIELLDMLNRLASNEELRGIILQGTGGYFSVGGDLAVLAGNTDSAHEIDTPADHISEVRGNAFGYGMSMALSGQMS
jgi:enoyl-CoA hydratase/carnithine racemase